MKLITFFANRYGWIIVMLITFVVANAQDVTKMKVKVLDVPVNGELPVPFDTLIVQHFNIQAGGIIKLTNPGRTTLIEVENLIIGPGVQFVGAGATGKTGTNGIDAALAKGACRNGLDGQAGSDGIAGTNGKNLILRIGKLTLADKFEIDLSGGNGGDGGNGGAGSAGAKSTAHCATNGGDGGKGGNGANGGDGGTLTFECKDCPAGVELIKVITLKNSGGYAGYGGEGGTGGVPGASAGKVGAAGKMGTKGMKGADGRSLHHTLISETAMK